MKSFILAIGLCVTLFLTGAVTSQEISGEHIESFNSEIQIQKEGSIEIKEIIVYDFGNDQRHGILRTIPITKTNKEGKQFRMDFDVDSVTNERAEPYQYAESVEGGEVELKIGDPNRTISGQHTYVISYTVSGAITYFSDHDELYWNSTGNGWDVPIASSSVSVTLPTGQNATFSSADCYMGYSGSTDTTCSKSIEGSRVVIKSGRVLQPSEGLTIAALFPKNIVSVLEPTEVVPFFDTIQGKIVLALLSIIAILWYIVYPIYLPLKWYWSGRDPFSQFGKAEALFDPPKTKGGRKLTPSETGAIIDEHAGPRELSALLVDLARRGFFKIVEKKKDEFDLEKTSEFAHDSSLRDFEKQLLTGLFSSQNVVHLKSAKLYDTVSEVQDKLYTSLVKEGYFPENPDKVRKFYMGIAAASAITFNFFLLLMASIFGRLMPKKTMDGVHAANMARSLKKFLSSQERQLEFQAKNQMFFEKLLPFAVAFGVEKIWAERFKDIDMKEPDWYVSSTPHRVFTADAFTRSLNSSFSSVSSAATPTTSSSGFSSGGGGGGFSGGGGGGGGGGSW